jgi:hypothetical protein
VYLLQNLFKNGVADLAIFEALIETMEKQDVDYYTVFAKPSGFAGLLQALHQFEKQNPKSIFRGGEVVSLNTWTDEGKVLVDRLVNSPMFLKGLALAETGEYTMEAMVQIIQGMLTLNLNRQDVISL